MYQEDFDYFDESVKCKGCLIYDNTSQDKRPLVLVAPAFDGRNAFSIEQGKRLAEQGYVAFVMDIYGDAKTGKTIEERVALMKPFADDRALLRRRVLAAFDAAKAISVVDTHKIGAMGYCFGGMCVLDLARAGADVKGVVGFHSVFKAPTGVKIEKIKGKVLLLHGYKDPMVPPSEAASIEKELGDVGVDWQLVMYGNAMHAFTDPGATEVNIGRKYDPLIAQRAWTAMLNFFAEVL